MPGRCREDRLEGAWHSTLRSETPPAVQEKSRYAYPNNNLQTVKECSLKLLKNNSRPIEIDCFRKQVLSHLARRFSKVQTWTSLIKRRKDKETDRLSWCPSLWMSPTAVSPLFLTEKIIGLHYLFEAVRLST